MLYYSHVFAYLSHPRGYNYCCNTKAKYMPGTFRLSLNKCLNKMSKEQREGKEEERERGEQQKRREGGKKNE